MYRIQTVDSYDLSDQRVGKAAGSCLLWVMSTDISVDIAVDIAVDSRSI